MFQTRNLSLILKATMKPILSLACLFVAISAYAQVGIGTNAPDSKSVLELRSKTKGFLPPRLTSAQRTTLAASLTVTQKGLQVSDSASGKPFYWTGTAWKDASTYTGTAPITVNASTNKIAINPGTAAGDLLTWDGSNWINTQPNFAPHFTDNLNNMQPYLVMNYCIAMEGIYPSRNGVEPFIGEIQLYGFNFAPIGFATCGGQLLSISQNTALFSLLGTIYGGNGQTTFALPDLRGRVPVHMGQGPGLSNRIIGETGGQEIIPISH